MCERDCKAVVEGSADGEHWVRLPNCEVSEGKCSKSWLMSHGRRSYIRTISGECSMNEPDRWPDLTKYNSQSSE